MISKHKVNSFCVNHNNLFSSIWSDINKSIIKRTQNHFYLMVTNLISSLSHYHHPKNIYFKSDSFRNNFINSHLEWNHLHLKKKKKKSSTPLLNSRNIVLSFFSYLQLGYLFVKFFINIWVFMLSILYVFDKIFFFKIEEN